MDSFFKHLRKRHLMPVLLVLCAAFILSLFLLPGELAFKAPQQEYENNDIRHSRIIFSRPSGFYKDDFVLKIKAPTTEIYYTLDGTDPVRGQEGTYRYTRKGIQISDATQQENVHSSRTDVTTGFDRKAVEEICDGDRDMHYQVPEDPVDKCTILRAVFYDIHDERSEIQTGAYFVGYEGRKGYGSAKVLSIVTDPENLFGYEKGIYVTGKTFDEFAAKDPFHDSSIWYRHCWWWWDANYNRRGRDWERPANVQFFSGSGELLLQQQAGIRIQGGGSRGFLPKSLNLYARKDYDGNSRFHYDFFGTGYEAKRLTLTSCGDDVYTRQKDRLVSELVADQDISVMHYEPCILFLDGEYWGIYYLTEKYDEKYFSKYYDVPEENVVEIKNNAVEIGSEDDLALYEEMRAFIEDSDMSVAENYKKACELIDIDSFISYYAAQIYCGRCGDWPQGNFALWRTRPAPPAEGDGSPESSTESATKAASGSGSTGGSDVSDTTAADPANPGQETSPYADGRWRWILFDVNSAAISPKLVDHDTLQYVLKSKKMKMFSSLWASPAFREKFAERLLEDGQTIFSPDSVNEKVDGYLEELSEPVEVHYNRFFGKDSGLDFREITKTEIRDFFENRYQVVESFLQDSLEEAE